MKEIFEKGNLVITKNDVDDKYRWHVNRVPVMNAEPEGMIELADAIYKAEGDDIATLRADLARVTAERDRLLDEVSRIYAKNKSLRDMTCTAINDRIAFINKIRLLCDEGMCANGNAQQDKVHTESEE